MKRVTAVLILAAMLMCMCACGEMANQGGIEGSTTVPLTTQPVVTQPTATQPERIELTVENVNEYLVFYVQTGIVRVEPEYGGLEMGKTQITMKASAKKNVEFEDVTISFVFSTTSTGWSSKPTHSVELAYDGTCEFSYEKWSNIESYVSSSPTFGVKVVSVSGSVIKK